MYEGERFNSISHLVGAVLALCGTIALILITSMQGDAVKIIAFAAYGTTLVLLYVISTIYHSVRGRAKHVFHKLDHLAIYLLIAGTYTPIALVILRGRLGWTIFAVVWSLAIFGIAQEMLIRRTVRIFSVALYLAMGWLILFAIRPLVANVAWQGLLWIGVGGFFYTTGIVFYALSKRLPHGHAIWHIFVLFGSIAHYIALLGWVALPRG